MEALIINQLDLDSIPFTKDGYTTNKSLRDLALVVILDRLHHRSQLAQIARDMRRAVGPDGFHAELRKAVQAYIEFEVKSAGGRPSAKSFFQDAKRLLLEAAAPQTVLETSSEAEERRDLAVHQAKIAQAAGLIVCGL
jgi:hypothetical protein